MRLKIKANNQDIKRFPYRWQRSWRHLVHLHRGSGGWRMGGMAWCLALLQLWWCNIRISSAAYRSVAVRIISLLGYSLGWAPEIWRREATWLRRQESIFSHLWRRWSTILSLRHQWWKSIRHVLGSSCKRESSWGLRECWLSSWCGCGC